MSDKKFLSIIIPIHNAQRFIARAIDSCLKQNFADFELILVNDGSKDDSLRIIKEYGRKDTRIRIIDIPKSGVVKAREFGVKASEADFVLFMDADDELAEGALQVMVDAISYDVDMVIGDICQIEVDGSANVIRYGNQGKVTGKEHFEWIVREHVGFIWGKLIRRELIENIQIMPYGVKFCEDYLQMIQMSYNAQKVVNIDAVTYNYIQQDESACNKALPMKEYAQRFADLCSKIADIVEQCVFDEQSLIALKVLFLYYCRLYLCSNGSWNPNKTLKFKFTEYMSDNNVRQYFQQSDKRRYDMTRLTAWLYPVISLVYRKQLKRNGRLR